MGEVYRARDTRLGRDVAIKVLPSKVRENSAVRERFDREAQAISRLSHPHVCTLYDIGHSEGVDFLVMEYLEGETLADALSRGPLPLPQVLRHGADIAEALDAAHRQGIIHRDLKPGNIMLTKSGVKILDFGLAKYTGVDTADATEAPTRQKPLTEEGTVLGTMPYMAPEQLEGRDADARTDIFALGAILYEMTTGHRAFEAKSRASLIAAIMEREPQSISAIQPATPLRLDHLIQRCMAKDADDRIQSARDLAFELREIHDEVRGASPGSKTLGRLSHRRPVIFLLLFVVLIAVAAAVWLGYRQGRPARDASRAVSIAVLPFADLGLDRSRDYLRLALPDEITTMLTYSPRLSVRPFSVSRRLNADIDPAEAAKKLNASVVIGGHLREEGGRLSVSLEAVDIEANEVVWRDRFDVTTTDLISMRRELSSRIQTALISRLAPGARQEQRPTAPHRQDAYELYLRAAALSSDVAPNEEGIRLLEEAVRQDRDYAPAWAALARRLYYDYAYSDGGERARRRAEEAGRLAHTLDPDLVEAPRILIVMQAESGDTVAAYREAAKLARRRPESADAHFILSYVLRYGGALDDMARECNTAMTLDPGNRGLRSCALGFMQLNDYGRALDFVRLDAGSEWSNSVIAMIDLRQGRIREAVPLTRARPRRTLVEKVVNGASKEEIDRAAAALRESQVGVDGEPYYWDAMFFSVAGYHHDVLRSLRESVRRGYCSYPAIDRDPLLEKVRALPEYAAFRDSAIACRERFLTGIAAHR